MRTEKVNFYSEGIKLAGVLYLPDSDQGKPIPESFRVLVFSASRTPNTTS